MMRGPHRYGAGRAIDADGGGVADLQTDVMRFMAILALCLVVIFALVQSIPQPVAAAPEQPAPVAEPAPVVEAPTVVETRPAPQPVVEQQPERVVVTRPALAPARPPREKVESVEVESARAVPSEPVAEPAPPPPEPSQRGFTLQFESDTALTRLVARNEVALFALVDSEALRMSVNRGRVSFWPASTPNTFHEMDPSTVPADVVNALRRGRGADAGVTWGVTLPANLQRELDTIVNANEGGALFIAGDGGIRLEP